MTYDPRDTICAIASPPGGAARGVVRVSGSSAMVCLSGLFAPLDATTRSPRAIAGHIALPALASPLPATLWLWPTARSYTREPCGELHTMGSPPLLEAIVARLCELGARLAQPGEFTLRAFLAGRIDLTQAEAVLGVIEARSPAQLERALSLLAGGLGRPLAELRSTLLDLLADLEAGLDFADEDLAFVTREALVDRLASARLALGAALAQLGSRQMSDALPRVALVGAPNAGKSSLFNALTGGAALVAPTPGTTRDYLEARVELPGGACLLIDTAGIEEANDDARVATMAQELSRQRREEADLELLCVAGDSPETATPRPHAPRLVVRTKADLAAGRAPLRAAVVTSAMQGTGLADLRAEIASRLADVESRDALAPSTARCREALSAAQDAIDEAQRLARRGAEDELIAVELRLALNSIGETIGAVYHEDLLDRLFSRFCIGK